MSTQRLLRLCILVALGLLIAAQPAEAQIWKKVKKQAKRTVEREAERKTDQAVRGAINTAEDAIVCAATDRDCIERAEEEGQDVVITDDEGNVVERRTASENAQAPMPEEALKPGEGVWANYDFVPGERVLFYDDFADGFTGDFPKRLIFKRGNMEVVEWEGQRLLRINSDGALDLPLPEVLPSRFTLELDVHMPSSVTTMRVYPVNAESESVPHHTGDQEGEHVIYVGSSRKTGVGTGRSLHADVAAMEAPALNERVVPIRVMVDDSYIKVYVEERRVANVPNANLGRTNTLRFWWHGVREPAYIGDIRVAAGGRQMMYDQLVAEGKVVTRGILFDTGSADIRPESTPTLKDIGQMLQKYGDLRLRIEGHTDNVGVAESNQQLSQQRAESVKAYLQAEYGIDPSRLEAEGKGQTAPAASNDTAEGRQSNRRVELVRL